MEYSQKVLDVLHGTGTGATATATGNGATAMIDRFRSCCNGDGATATMIDRNCNGNGERGLGHWGKSNRTVLQQNSDCSGATIDQSIVFYIAEQNVDNSGW
jgi:hypothetical protein